MNNPLFLDNKANLQFEKIAMAIKLSDNADNWQQEISSEIYKHLPYLTDFSVNVLLERVNPERGYAFGSAQVTNKTDQPSPAGPTVTIPLLVKDRLLQSLDVMMKDGKAFPLSEERLQTSLFDGRTFETSSRKPVDQGLVDQLHPPIRTGYGSGSGVTTGAASGGGAGFGKFASLCEAIASTVSEEAVDNLVDTIMGDEQVKLASVHNEAFQAAVLGIAECDRQSLQKTAASMVDNIRPTAVQFTKTAEGNFRIKWAAAEAFAPQEAEAGPGQAQDMAGTDAIQGMQPGENVTVGTEQAEKPDPKVVTPAPVEHFGQYRVMDMDSNQEKTGWVMPVMDFACDELPMLLFTDGESYSLQDTVVGVLVDNSSEGIPTGEPQGNGAFVLQREDGSYIATLPVSIQNQTQDPEGNASFMAEDAFGQQLELSLVQGLQTCESMGEGKYGIPADMQFMPLGEAIHLAKFSDEPEKVKEARAMPRAALLRSTGDGEFHLDGIPFAKLASEERQWLNAGDAEFLMVTAGMNQFQTREKLAEATQQGHANLYGLNHITPLSSVHEEAVKEASALLQDFPYDLRRDLIKEAAALEDSETADKILAMNFLNPENIGIFAGYLPELDEAASKLAEMLIAARMGMNQVDEGALERSMLNLEEVIKGLRALQQKQLL